VHGLGNLLGVLDGVDERRNKRLDIPVVAGSAGELHGLGSGLLHLGLGVPHGLADDGNGLVEGLGKGDGVLLRSLSKESERPHLGLPLGVLDALVKHLLHRLDSPWAHHGHHRRTGLLRKSAHLVLLMRHGLEDVGKHRHDKRLHSRTADARERLDNDERVLQGLGILNHLLELLNRA